jgi:hypothetical protein
MTRVNPGPGERRVVDQACPGEPVQGRVGSALRHSAAPQGLIKLRPRARGRGQQPQADLQGRSLRVSALLVVAIAGCPATYSATRHRLAA